MTLEAKKRLSYADRINGLQGIIARYKNGLMPVAPPRQVGAFTYRGRNMYHGLGTMLLSWADAAPEQGITREWIERTVIESQFANGTWSTYGETVAPCLNGITPSTAYAVLALTAKDRRLPFLQTRERR